MGLTFSHIYSVTGLQPKIPRLTERENSNSKLGELTLKVCIRITKVLFDQMFHCRIPFKSAAPAVL